MTIPKKDPLEKCNLQQACEWLLYMWKPYDTHHEDDFIDKVRKELPFESKGYKQKAVVLISALLQGEIFLYTIDDNGKYNQIDLKQDSKNRNYLTVALGNSAGSISILNTISPMGVYFDFAELEKVFPNGEYKTNEGMVKPNKNPLGHKVYFEDGDLLLLKSDGSSPVCLLKTRAGMKKDIIKYIIEHPNEILTIQQIRKWYPNKKDYYFKDYRWDNVFVDMFNESVLKKINEKSLKSVFYYKKGEFCFRQNP